ncbi:MAG: 1-deoxy-D-xylulose-5-phosphate synthase [Eubacteriales bacterium]
MLEKIKSSKDIKSLPPSDLYKLTEEIRNTIIRTVSRNGGHLASNLGMVEATVALHKVFDLPNDKLVFDVGHQCYAHKLLTGRYEQFPTIRQYGGISGFPNRNESEYDVLNEGHSGTSVSAALGIAKSNELKGNDNYAVAIVGDGSLTNGLIYEALNNCSNEKLNLIILVNDNEMSISQNVGGLHKYLTRIRTSKKYFHFKRGIEYILAKIPLIGKPLAILCSKIKNFFKRMFVKETFFEALGLDYLGPVDGNNLDKMITVLTEAKKRHCCCVVHMKTKKGFGYEPAEKNPQLYHSVSPFDDEKGAKASDKYTFSDAFGDIVCECAKNDNKICAITAAMCDGTGLCRFAKEYPERFFDVGIAEEHAVTFASGLAVNGLKPILALYSTFAQRVYDQIFHDISIQNLPLVLALDHSGLVDGDGITHQGIFDYSIFSSLPSTVIYSPENYAELSSVIKKSLEYRSLSVIRYPKGCEITGYDKDVKFISGEDALFSYTDGAGSCDILIITSGRITYNAYCALELLRDKYSVGILKLIKVFPIDDEIIVNFAKNAKLVYILEEGIKSGSMAEKICSAMSTNGLSSKIAVRAIDGYINHGSLCDLYGECGFSKDQIASEIENLAKDVLNG